jgi:hypothetical protein
MRRTILLLDGLSLGVGVLQVRLRGDQEFIPETCECISVIEALGKLARSALCISEGNAVAMEEVVKL